LQLPHFAQPGTGHSNLRLADSNKYPPACSTNPRVNEKNQTGCSQPQSGKLGLTLRLYASKTVNDRPAMETAGDQARSFKITGN